MDFSSICRTCLGQHSLHPIFESTNDPEIYSNAIFICSGVQVKPDDSLPQNMCTACLNQLNNTLKFRKQCKKVEEELLKIQTKLESFKTDFTIKNEKEIIIKLTNNTIKRKKESNTDISKSNIIKTEFNNINVKNEQSLNLLLESPIIQKNCVNEEDADNINADDIFDNKEEFKTINDFEIDTNNSTHNFFIDNKLKNNNIKAKHTLKILKNNAQEILKRNESNAFDNTDDEDSNIPEDSDVNSTENNIEVPYHIVTDSVKNKTVRVVCKLCQKELSIRSIDSHMARRHPGADERKVKCELCDKYVMKEKLNRHRMMMHGSAGFKCGYCKTEFKNKELLVGHVDTCQAKKRKRKVNESGRELAECDVCNKSMQKASLRMHKAVKHAGLRPVCEHCGKCFGNKFRLNEHYRAKHGYEKFQCTYCEFRSAGIMAMRNHERRHRGEKPYVCETCGAKFHAAYLLTQHRHSHRTEKLVKCDLCPASFKANNSLHMHKLTCHSKSVYRCTICGRSYKCRYYAVKHVRMTHSCSGTLPLVKMTS